MRGMTAGSPAGRILYFALPLPAGSPLRQLCNTADRFGPDYMYLGCAVGRVVGPALFLGWYFSGRWKRHGSLAEEKGPEISGPEGGIPLVIFRQLRYNTP